MSVSSGVPFMKIISVLHMSISSGVPFMKIISVLHINFNYTLIKLFQPHYPYYPYINIQI